MIRVSMSTEQLTFALFMSNCLMLVPFLIADIVYLYTTGNICILAYIPTQPNNPFQIIQLGQWLRCDGFIKLAVVVTGLYLLMLKSQVKYDKIIHSCYANTIRLFWAFDLGWTIVGSVLFWGGYYNFTEPIFCNSGINGYMWVVLITNYLFFIIGYITTFIRSNQSQNSQISMLQGQNNNIYA